MKILKNPVYLYLYSIINIIILSLQLTSENDAKLSGNDSTPLFCLAI